jgi:methionyl-tRNA formyltransferase
MRIALFNIDGLATNAPIGAFIAAHAQDIAYVGLSPPFRRQRGGFFRQSLRHLQR